MDNQWLIVDGIGKQGIDSNGHNFYPPVNIIQDSFMAEGVGHPYNNFSPYVANSLFAIFDDLSYFNERTTTYSPKYFTTDLLPVGNTTSQREHNFICRNRIDNPINLLHAYLSNIYEGDDPPQGLNILPGNKVGIYGYGNPYVIIPSVSQASIQANHSVAPSKDITIILDHQAIINESGSGIYRFEFNHYNIILQNIQGHTSDFLELSPLDNVGSVISGGAFSIIDPTGVIEIEVVPKTNTFINLRPLDPKHPLFPALQYGNTDYAENEALFILKNIATQKQIIHKEAIRAIQ